VLRRLHCHFVCSSTGHWRLAFFLIGGSSRLLPPFLRVGNVMMWNYRGIAILSTVGKLFELLVYGHMYEDLKGQLAVCQHGFVKGRSTVSNLLEYFFVWSQLRLGVRWIQSTRTSLRPLIKCVIVCSFIKCRVILSHPADSG
jgi:hypothetical protein